MATLKIANLVKRYDSTVIIDDLTLGDDPEWKAVAERTQANGPIVSKVESVFLETTDFSPLK